MKNNKDELDFIPSANDIVKSQMDKVEEEKAAIRKAVAPILKEGFQKAAENPEVKSFEITVPTGLDAKLFVATLKEILEPKGYKLSKGFKKGDAWLVSWGTPSLAGNMRDLKG